MGISGITSIIRGTNGRISGSIRDAAADMGALIFVTEDEGINVFGLSNEFFDSVSDVYVMSDGSVTQDPTRDAAFLVSPCEKAIAGGQISRYIIADHVNDDDETRISASTFEHVTRGGDLTIGLILMIPEMGDQSQAA